MFRKRDSALLHTLKGQAITWLKSEEINFVDGLHIVPSNVVLAYLVSHHERDALALLTHGQAAEDTKITTDLASGVQPYVVGRGLKWSLKSWVSRLSGATVPAKVVAA
jgi:hypothetical protein